VALTLAKQRLMTAVFDYYELAHPEEGVGSGFKYQPATHITSSTIANNEPPGTETLYDQPLVDRKRTRVSGPFTVEAVPAPAVKSVEEALTPTLSQREREFGADGSIARSGETLRRSEWRDELLRVGIRGKAGQHIRFARLEPLPGCRWLHADGETRPSAEGADRVRETGPAYSRQRIVVSFGPEHAPLEQRQVAQAIEEAQTLVPRPKLIVFAAFQFDPEAAKDIDETNWPGVALLKAQMNADLLTDDLKKKRASNESFWLIGQPDVRLEQIAKGEDKGKWRVSVEGFDYYNTKTGSIESGGSDRIAVWLLDTDYDGRSLYPRQVFFPMAGESEGWARLAKNLKAEIDEELIEAYRGTVSLPFAPGEHKRIAVKIVDDRGIESLKVMGVE
jgi:adenine-specific DNA-methyltransferase